MALMAAFTCCGELLSSFPLGEFIVVPQWGLPGCGYGHQLQRWQLQWLALVSSMGRIVEDLPPIVTWVGDPDPRRGYGHSGELKGGMVIAQQPSQQRGNAVLSIGRRRESRPLLLAKHIASSRSLLASALVTWSPRAHQPGSAAVLG